jgi:hypothetical protein
MNLKKAILLRSWIAFLLILGFAVAIFVQIFKLQVYQSDKYNKIS